MKTSTAVTVLVVLIFVLGGGWWYFSNKAAAPAGPGSQSPVATAAFACDAGKSIGATFYEGSTTPPTSADQPPTPNGSVTLVLSDGRTETLPQTISASGIRYANADESFIFWGKGNTAFVQEGPNQDQTYAGCILVAPDPTGALTQIFASSTMGVSIRFPQGFTANQNYVYSELGPGQGHRRS